MLLWVGRWGQPSRYRIRQHLFRHSLPAGPAGHGGVRAVGQALHPHLPCSVLPSLQQTRGADEGSQAGGQHIKVLELQLGPGRLGGEDKAAAQDGSAERALPPVLADGGDHLEVERWREDLAQDLLQVREVRDPAQPRQLLRDGDWRLLLRGLSR